MATTVTVEALWDQESTRSLDDRVDSWLVDFVDDTVDFAAGRLRAHAPGRIDELVTSDGPQFEPEFGVIQGVAGVIPDPNETFVSARGSKRADFPLFVDVGTGIYGEHQRPITSFPPNQMGPVEVGGRMVYLDQIKGQPAQDYSGEATRDTDAWIPGHIRASAPRLGDL